MSWTILFSPVLILFLIVGLLMLYALSGNGMIDLLATLFNQGAKLTCWHCGQETPANQKTCRHCHKELQ